MSERVAVIDVGSNAVRLLVAELDAAGGATVVDQVRDQTRLAAGLVETGRLSEPAIGRALEALARMREVCRRRAVTRIAAVATAAVRDAANGGEFVRRVREELDIPLRVIDAETEAGLAWRSAAHHFRLTGTRALVADIGGGSLELIGAVDGLIELTRSLPLGAVRMTEMHLPGGLPARKEVRELRATVRKALRRVVAWREWSAATVIGSGGTFTTLGRMALARRGVPAPGSAHGVEVLTPEVEQLLESLTALPPERRRQVPGLAPERADIIVAGLAVAAELLSLARAPSVRVSGFGLREGLLLELAGRTDAPADPLRLAREFAERCRGDLRHPEQVRRLALALYDQLGAALGATPPERDLLEAAALLHDVGQLVSYRQHHKHSYWLITHADRLGLAARERELVALASRYHRRRGPRRKHREFAALAPADQAVVRRVSALLRVADGLDRGQTAAVDAVRTELTADALIVRVTPRVPGADLELECWGAARKADVLAKLLGREVAIRAEPAYSYPAYSYPLGENGSGS